MHSTGINPPDLNSANQHTKNRSVEAKELICMTHGHELKGGNVGVRGVCRAEGNKGGKMGQL